MYFSICGKLVHSSVECSGGGSVHFVKTFLSNTNTLDLGCGTSSQTHNFAYRILFSLNTLFRLGLFNNTTTTQRIMQRNEKKENDQRQKWIGKRARREKERQHTGERERERHY